MSWLHSKSASRLGSVHDADGGAKQPKNEAQLTKKKVTFPDATCPWGAITFLVKMYAVSVSVQCSKYKYTHMDLDVNQIQVGGAYIQLMFHGQG